MDAPGPAALTESRLRAAGVRVTRPRLAVLDALEGLGGHRGVDEISAELGRRGQAVPVTTIYNVVGALARAGVLMAADAGPGRALFEVANGRHHHFVCRSCGTVVDVPCSAHDAPCVTAPLPGADVEQASIIFWGRCASCAGAPVAAEDAAWT